MPRRSAPSRNRITSSLSSRTQLSIDITPAFTSWVRNVIVPALIKAYMRELSLKKGAVRG
jgi:hypothetical protein